MWKWSKMNIPKQINIKTVSELINVLQWLQDQYGDLPINLDVFDIAEYPQSIDSVNYGTDENDNNFISLNSF